MSIAALDIAEAVAALSRGELIGLPTETVYGLAADARNSQAVQKIFALKGRPADHPLIVHLHHVDQLPAWAANIPSLAWQLAERFWPGPMTLILERAAGVSDLVTGGQDSIGIRIPSHPIAARVLAQFGDGLAAPSANRFGHISPTTSAHVRAEFGSELNIILDGGACSVGIESTIIDVRGIEPCILRPGSIGLSAIAELASNAVQGTKISSPRVSGALASHYAPRTPTRLVQRSMLNAASRVGALALALETLPEGVDGIALPAESGRYAHGLYAALRALDARGAQAIWVESPPFDSADSDWSAVEDRLTRACTR